MTRFRYLLLIVGLVMIPLTIVTQSPVRPANRIQDGFRTREDVDLLRRPENKAKLDALKLAFKTLQQSANPTSNMKFWANIHGAPLGEMATGPCEHNSELIWPWHRAYLYAFESALRASHPPETSNVTIPYWNWMAPPSGHRFPAIFEETDSPLNYTDPPPPSRSTQPFPLSPLDGNTETHLLNEVLNWNDFGGVPKEQEPGKGELESLAHDPVHGFIGGHNSNTARAARDPIFWSHHANLDRLWVEWQKKFNQKPVGLNQILVGIPGNPTVNDWVDVSAKYAYGPKAPSPFAVEPQIFASVLKLKGEAAALTFPVKLPSTEPKERLVLELAKVRLSSESKKFLFGRIYLHPTDQSLAQGGAQFKKEYYLTYFGFWNSGHQQHGSSDKIARGVDVFLDITKKARQIASKVGDKPLALSFEFFGEEKDGEAQLLTYDGVKGVRINKVLLLIRNAMGQKKSEVELKKE
jgi:tyrosinase